MPPGRHEEYGSAPGGSPGLPLDGGYRDFPPGDDYRAPDGGYREPPGPARHAAPAQSAGRQQGTYPPTGPLPVGRWHSDEHPPLPEYPPLPAEEGFSPEDGFPPDEFPDDPLSASYRGEAEQGYLPSPPTDTFPAPPLSAGYRGEGGHRGGYDPDQAVPEREYGHSRGRS
jgi:hypothetical protein